MEPTSAHGAPELTVSGLNVLHQLPQANSTTWAWERHPRQRNRAAEYPHPDDKSSADPTFSAAHRINEQRAAMRRSPLTTSPRTTSTTSTSCSRRAKRRARRLHLRGRSARESHRRTPGILYFGPPDATRPGSAAMRDVTFRLRWGASLTDSSPTLTTANQVKPSPSTAGTVPRRRRSPVKATLDDKELPSTSDLHELLQHLRSARGDRRRPKPVHSGEGRRSAARRRS